MYMCVYSWLSLEVQAYTQCTTARLLLFSRHILSFPKLCHTAYPFIPVEVKTLLSASSQARVSAHPLQPLAETLGCEDEWDVRG